jgi:hypothetical protein
MRSFIHTAQPQLGGHVHSSPQVQAAPQQHRDVVAPSARVALLSQLLQAQPSAAQDGQAQELTVALVESDMVHLAGLMWSARRVSEEAWPDA